MAIFSILTSASEASTLWSSSTFSKMIAPMTTTISATAPAMTGFCRGPITCPIRVKLRVQKSTN